MTWLRRSLLVTVVATSSLTLAACGATSTSTVGSKVAPVFLCRHLSSVARVVVTRTLSSDQFLYVVPATSTVNNARRARQLARVACSLPVMPSGIQCPVELAVAYRLTFAINGEKGLGGESIVVHPTGCQLVEGLGTPRTSATRANFYRLLGTAIGISNAGSWTFAGETHVHGITETTSDLTITLHLSSTTVVAGTPLAAIVTIVNHTATALQPGSDCYLGQWLQVGLENAAVKFTPVYTMNFCRGGTWIRPGTNTFHVSVQSAYTHCTRSHSSIQLDSPRCTSAMAMPALPAGKYFTKVVITLANASITLPAPIAVRVLAR